MAATPDQPVSVGNLQAFIRSYRESLAEATVSFGGSVSASGSYGQLITSMLGGCVSGIDSTLLTADGDDLTVSQGGVYSIALSNLRVGISGVPVDKLNNRTLIISIRAYGPEFDSTGYEIASGTYAEGDSQPVAITGGAAANTSRVQTLDKMGSALCIPPGSTVRMTTRLSATLGGTYTGTYAFTGAIIFKKII